MRTVLRLMILGILGLWAWLALSGAGLLVWQRERPLELQCFYITALDLIEARFLYAEHSPLGRERCPSTLQPRDNGSEDA